MAKEALTKIKEAEGAAAEILRLAAEQAKAIAEKAAADAAAHRNAAMLEAGRQKHAILENAEKEAAAERAPIIDACSSEIEKISLPAPEKFDKAVNTVIERIMELKWQ
ncbi:MAG: hypothetical protein FWG34_05870 [Oscillospiraceae bacterium]|nr:hypothetical protein [Oscillospiraceae bacterium]